MRRILILCMFLLQLSLATALAQDTPMISASPGDISLNEQITVTGSGFEPGAMVTLFLGLPDVGPAGEPLTSVQADENGSITATFVMPGTWPAGDPIRQPQILVVASDQAFSPLASTELIHQPAPLTELGWREAYHEALDFSVMVPSEWTQVDYPDGFGFRIGEGNIDILSVRAIISPETINDQPADQISLEEYAGLAAPAELGGTGTITLSETTPFTSAHGAEGYLSTWTLQDENSQSVDAWSTVYFDFNDTVEGGYARSIQVTGLGALPRGFFTTVAGTFTRGHQPDNPVSTEQEYGFALDLPEGWEMDGPHQNPVGVEYYLGPAPLGTGNLSTIVVTDAASYNTAAEIERLRQLWPDIEPSIEQTTLGGMPAQRVQFIVDAVAVDYFLVEHQGRLYSVHIHEPDSLATRSDVIATFRFGNGTE